MKEQIRLPAKRRLRIFFLFLRQNRKKKLDIRDGIWSNTGKLGVVENSLLQSKCSVSLQTLFLRFCGSCERIVYFQEAG